MSAITQRPFVLDAYRKSDHSTRLRYIKVSVVLFLLLMPTFAALDWLVYPQHFWQMLRIRLVFDAVFVGIFVLTFTRLTKYIKTFGVVSALIAGFSICWLVYVAEGASSPYYAGLNLIVVVMSVILPWTLIETGVVCIATIFTYGIACHLHTSYPEMTSEQLSIFHNNLFFLAATSLICVTASHYQSIRRFQEFRLNYELDLRNKKLAELDRLKSQFFANISHELRTPLTLILAPLQELLDCGDCISKSIADRLVIVRDNSLRLLKLVNDLLDVIRMEEGKASLESVPVEINSILNGLVESMVHLASTKNIRLQKRLVDDPLVVKGDIRALEKIFVNLLNNAIKFTGRGGSVTVESGRTDGQIIVRVHDTGIGIEADEMVRIFDRFHQVDGTSTRRYQGTGLGLALVKEMTERQGGQVSVESVPGVGTTMSVHFPNCDDVPLFQNEVDPAPYDGLADMHRMAERTGGMTVEDLVPDQDYSLIDEGSGRPLVLVVDDEPDMRRYLVGVLKEEYRVLQARDGIEGLKLAHQHKPDLMLLDVMLPEMDGLEVCRRIKQDRKTRGPKIMLLTARADEQAKLTALQNGADDFLTKPFSSLEVKTRLHNLWETARLERDLAERNQGLERTLAELKSTQGQLIQSEKLNALGSLSAGLLHEINNPLNYSLTALQLIRGDDSVQSNELLRDMVSDIDEGMQRIRVIVSDLRAFAYPSQAEKQTPFDLRDALESALRFTAHELKGVRLEQELAPGLRVVGSKSHIVQVFVNLLTNAVKAIEPLESERPGEIRINSSEADGRVSVHVSDNGVGMGAEILERIFDPFFTTREVGTGMGLGLSICHTIVENHGGSMCAESRPGEGSVLTFDLPLATKRPVEYKQND